MRELPAAAGRRVDVRVYTGPVRVIAGLAVVGLFLTTASAQPAPPAPAPPAPPAPTVDPAFGAVLPPPPTPPDKDAKDESAATGMAVAGALGGLGVMGLGFANLQRSYVLFGVGALIGLVGPSLGQFYAGEILTPGLGLRAVGLGALGYSGLVLSQCDEGCGAAGLPLLAGLGLYVAGAIYDLATTPRAVRAWNAAHHHVTLAPTVVPTGAHASLGLGVVGTF